MPIKENDIKNINFYDDKGNVINTATTLTATCKINPSDFSLVFGFDKEVPLELPNGKTYLYERDGEMKAGIYKDGKLLKISSLIPAIVDVQVIAEKVVIVVFSDGTKEKATLSAYDSFSFENGISICIAKKMLSMKTCGNGSSVYNKLIDYCIGVCKRRFREKSNAELEEKRRIEAQKNHHKKAEKKKEKKANAEREAQIEIHKEAYLRALKEFNETTEGEE